MPLKETTLIRRVFTVLQECASGELQIFHDEGWNEKEIKTHSHSRGSGAAPSPLVSPHQTVITSLSRTARTSDKAEQTPRLPRKGRGIRNTKAYKDLIIANINHWLTPRPGEWEDCSDCRNTGMLMEEILFKYLIHINWVFLGGGKRIKKKHKRRCGEVWYSH